MSEVEFKLVKKMLFDEKSGNIWIGMKFDFLLYPKLMQFPFSVFIPIQIFPDFSSNSIFLISLNSTSDISDTIAVEKSHTNLRFSIKKIYPF